MESPSSEMEEDGLHETFFLEEFKILHGDIMGLSDTLHFLKSLSQFDTVVKSEGNTERPQMSEQKPAGLFNWEEDIYVARAPGRLDVMGGVADNFGSLVLQMPTKEACHVAIQKIHPTKQRLWKHAQPRKITKGQGLIPVLQIELYSYGSRGQTFDMDLSDFLDGDQPISYEAARNYFAQDLSQRWAAYIAGTILVLMKELCVRFENSISMLVSSSIPEGKGVSSSASVEVATMSAIAASHGLNIDPRKLALLCQKVKNHVVGAPCGIMDQMTSACGEANKLLAMVCQPAEVLGLVDIPSHIRFWGIDAGIQHSSTSGVDYESVQSGAFMGQTIMKLHASELIADFRENGLASEDLEEDGVELLETEASLDYLCNLSPHRYEGLYVKQLPETMLGKTFLEKYKDHNDPFTVINSKRIYRVLAATRHPIYENFCVKAFKALLTSATSDNQLTALGELMYQCHYSCSACGLRSDGTDRILQLVQEMQHSKVSKLAEGTLYGAKITDGGIGGTVCIVGRNSMQSSEQILQIQQKYKGATGYLPFVFEGSSPGAGRFSHLIIRRRPPGVE